MQAQEKTGLLGCIPGTLTGLKKGPCGVELGGTAAGPAWPRSNRWELPCYPGGKSSAQVQ